MTFRRFKLLTSTAADYERGDPSGPVPVIEIDDQTGQINIAGTAFGTLSSIAGSNQVLFSFTGTPTGNSNLQFDPSTSTLSTANLVVATHPPLTSSSLGVTGQITWDSNSFYVCTATNSWVKTTLSTF